MAFDTIKVASPESVMLDEAFKTVEDLGFKSQIRTEDAVRYGQGVVPFLTESLNQKALFALGYPQIIFKDRRLQTPTIHWGVVGVDRVAGTLAAMQSIQREAQEAGYTGELTARATGDVGKYEIITRVWCVLALINPELQLPA